MEAEAWGANHRVIDHTLAKGAKIDRCDPRPDGSLSVTFKTSQPIHLKGEYYVRLTFTAARIDQVYRQSIAGTARGKIEAATPDRPEPTFKARKI
jgi:hypothetical protein